MPINKIKFNEPWFPPKTNLEREYEKNKNTFKANANSLITTLNAIERQNNNIGIQENLTDLDNQNNTRHENNISHTNNISDMALKATHNLLLLKSNNIINNIQAVKSKIDAINTERTEEQVIEANKMVSDFNEKYDMQWSSMTINKAKEI